MPGPVARAAEAVQIFRDAGLRAGDDRRQAATWLAAHRRGVS
jgi:hypothetical protein